ncbi:MAG: ImmA/IrrE family metallo-endopeptidase [Elusimicrobiales bacterium]
MKFYRNAEIERIADEKLQTLSLSLGKPLSAPIPVELMAEKVMGLNLLWEPIQELPGEVILGGLMPEDKLIVLNENRQKLFNEKPGLERFTIGHELGHWELFVGKHSFGSLLPGIDATGPVLHRETGRGLAEIIKALIQTEEGVRAVAERQSRTDPPDEARVVNRFSAALLMPADLLRAEALKIDRTQWRNLYQLAERFGVTITALTVRLKQLDLLSVGEDKKLYGSADEAKGQMTLGL